MKRLAALVCAALAAACQEKPPEPAAEDVQAARQAAMKLDMRFRQEIISRLEREPAVAVYLAYRDHAQEHVREASLASGLVVRRIGLRVRNAANTPDEWEADQMEEMNALVSMGYDLSILEASAIVKEGERTWMRWIKPVGMDEACMVCHGDNIPAELLKLIRQDYAEDDATGYYESEMRGAYSVRKLLDGPPLETPSPSPSATPTFANPAPAPLETAPAFEPPPGQ